MQPMSNRTSHPRQPPVPPYSEATMTTAAARPRRRAPRGQGELLRGEILQAAKDLLAERGDEDSVSVRSVAERVGVSTPSIYLPFPDKSALIAAVCQDVFAELDQEMEAAAAAASSPFLGLRARGHAYARFALANPEHYRIVMMGRPHVGHEFFSGDDLTSSATFAHLVAAVAQCREAGVFSDAQPDEQVAFGLWAAAHGAVSLVIAKPMLNIEDSLAMCDQTISAAGIGLAVLARLPEEVAETQDSGSELDLVALLDTMFRAEKQAAP